MKGRRLPRVVGRALDTSLRVSNANAGEELGWRPRFPTYREGTEAMVAAPARASRPGKTPTSGPPSSR
jgi:hypothetical protein